MLLLYAGPRLLGFESHLRSFPIGKVLKIRLKRNKISKEDSITFITVRGRYTYILPNGIQPKLHLILNNRSPSN